ncbi:hypothetical protein HYW76_03205 [Candidatus Pacearchaeota archaeon]|nr:hypothetical protein [Candidatus Pacearchaeota archaeon]
MKKESVMLLLILFLANSVYAIESNIRQEYLPGETFIAYFSGNFADTIYPENVQFFSDRKFIPMIYDVIKISDKYYVYALLPNAERNYTLIIKNVRYTELGKEKTEDLYYNFSARGNIVDFSVNPGVILANKDFSIKILSKLNNINLFYTFMNNSAELSLKPDEEKKLDFSISSIADSAFLTLFLASGNFSYEIPVSVFKNSSTLPSNNENFMRFTRKYLNISVIKDYPFQIEISLSNFGAEDIFNVSFNNEELSDIIAISPLSLDKLSSGEIKIINLTIKSSDSGIISKKIKAYSSNYTSEMSLDINTIEDEETFTDNLPADSEQVNQEDCAEFSGLICKAEEECSGIIRLTKDGVCCVGQCSKKSSSSNLIWIILIILVLAAAGYFFYKRIKAKKQTSKEILENKGKSYEERFHPKEVRGELTKN